MDYEILGKLLRDARNNGKITQSGAAELVGVTFQNVSSWERGKSKIDIETLLELCKIYKISFTSVLEQSGATDEKKEAPAISAKAMEVARAYDKADCGTQVAVCKILDLSPTEYRAPHIPDMQQIRKGAEAFAEYANKNLKTPVKK